MTCSSTLCKSYKRNFHAIEQLPLESLTAFAIKFFAGIFSAAGVTAYVAQVRKSAARERSAKPGREQNRPIQLEHRRAPANGISMPWM